jgi:GTPase SAR1 family protein
MYFRNAAGALLVFDQTTPSSFDDVERIWLPELLPHMKNSTQYIVMCGNKSDAVDAADSEVARFLTKVEAMCSSRGIKFFSTSAKRGANINEVFSFLVDEIMDGRAKEAAAAKAEKPAPTTVSVTAGSTSDDGGSKGKSGCCK